MPDPEETSEHADGGHKDSWLHDRHESTEEEKREWDDAGLPAHIDIIAGFLRSNDLIFGLKDRSELFRLDKLRRDAAKTFGATTVAFGDMLCLHYVQPSPIPKVYFTEAYPPIGVGFGDIIEVNYNVRLQALVRQMALTSIEIEHGSESDDSSKVVFLGTEFPGAAIRREIRVVRITVLDFEHGYGTWEEVAKTNYPGRIF